jgi:hypothetical protein
LRSSSVCADAAPPSANKTAAAVMSSFMVFLPGPPGAKADADQIPIVGLRHTGRFP